MIRRAALVLACLTACENPPVSWSEVEHVGSFPGTSPVFAAPSPACPGSGRSARLATSELAVWWEIRADSSAMLRFSRRADGTWSAPVTIDSADRGRRGCARPAPAIAADSATGSVHVAYFLEPAGGAGVFFAHSMDGGELFHDPVPIVFGRRPSQVDVDADGDRVAVAYEEPNAERPQVFVALSATMGHIFEHRAPLSSENVTATGPRVRVTGDSVDVRWRQRSHVSSSEAGAARRAGRWK